MNKNLKQEIIFMIFILLAYCIGVGVVALDYPEKVIIKMTTPNLEHLETEQELDDFILTECDQTEVGDFAYCIREFAVKHYKYNITEKAISHLDLFKTGGDCKSWSKFYFDLGEKAGFTANQTYLFQNFGNKGHVFTILYDENLDYCILENESVRCFKSVRNG